MKLYRPGAIAWDETQAIYHALAQAEQEGLVLCRPVGRCVCLGLHDDLVQEVDQRYCQENNIPIIRRDIGGGMVLLAEEQIFFQLVLRADNPLLRGHRASFFGKFLQPALHTLADFSIEAAIKRPADIVVRGKKISGNGAGDINGFAVYTGNLLLAFDREVMAHIFNVPSSCYRSWIQRSLEQYLTTMQEELGYLPDIETVEQRLAHHFAAWLELEPATYSAELQLASRQSANYLTSQEFLSLPGKKSAVRKVKINEGTFVRLHPFPQCIKSTMAGQSECGNRLGRPCAGYAVLVIQDNRIIQFEIQGLTCLEKNNINLLAAFLVDSCWQKSDVRQAVAGWIQTYGGSMGEVLQDTLIDWILAN